MAHVVLGVFSDRNNAEGAITELKSRDYDTKDISIVMKDDSRAREIAQETGASDVAGDTIRGAGTGAVIGGLAGLLAGTVLPGLGGFLIGGPIGAALGLTGAAAATVSGAATGAVAGGILGALMSMFNLNEEDARAYETRINEGGILVAVPTVAEDVEEVRMIMYDYSADNIRHINTAVQDQISERDARPESREYYQRVSGIAGGMSKRDRTAKKRRASGSK